jgi:hypothetical protein
LVEYSRIVIHIYIYSVAQPLAGYIYISYIHLCPEAFDADTVKIIWVMSYMKSGQAGHWATREFKYEATSQDGRLHFLDWVNFEDEFHKDFMPLNAEAIAINALETSAYFQGK